MVRFGAAGPTARLRRAEWRGFGSEVADHVGGSSGVGFAEEGAAELGLAEEHGFGGPAAPDASSCEAARPVGLRDRGGGVDDARAKSSVQVIVWPAVSPNSCVCALSTTSLIPVSAPSVGEVVADHRGLARIVDSVAALRSVLSGAATVSSRTLGDGVRERGLAVRTALWVWVVVDVAFDVEMREEAVEDRG